MILVELFEICILNFVDILFKIFCGNKGFVLNGNFYSLGYFKFK